jgi:predicted enzyme related to lactoylglutathione lyase
MKINLLVIKTANIHTLKDFYCLLGCEFEYHCHEQGIFHYAANIEGVVFEIYPLPKEISKVDKSTRLGFEVADLAEMMVNLKENKVKIISELKQTETGIFAIIADLDGRKIELFQKK